MKDTTALMIIRTTSISRLTLRQWSFRLTDIPAKAGIPDGMEVPVIGRHLPVGGAFRAPTPLKAMVAFAADRKPDDTGTELACCLNHWMQTILRGEPGPPPS